MTEISQLAPRIVVLCGSLRSGTTLLRLLLGEHPLITGRGESDFLFDGFPASALETGGTPEQRQAFAAAIAQNRIPQAQGIKPPAPQPITAMIAAMIEQSMPADGKLLLTLHRHADVAAQALPGAAFVHLRRDPRDVAISAMKMGWAGNPFYGVDAWRRSERDWHEAQQFIAGPSADIAFEALTADPEGALRDLLSAIGLSFDPAVLAPPEGSTYSAPSPTRNQAWRSVLSEREAGEIDWRVRDVPDDGLYELKPQKPSIGRRASLFAGNKLGRHAQAVERYGLGLHFGERVATRFNLPGASRLRERRTAIDIAHLK